MITNHFPPDIRKGIINSGFKDTEDIEGYLRRLDSVEAGTVTNTNRQTRIRIIEIGLVKRVGKIKINCRCVEL